MESVVNPPSGVGWRPQPCRQRSLALVLAAWLYRGAGIGQAALGGPAPPRAGADTGLCLCWGWGHRGIVVAGAVLVLVLTAVAPPRLWGSPPQGASHAPVASVNGRIITRDELDQRVRSQLQALEERIYQLRASALHALIGEVLIEQEARRRGITVNDLIAEIAAKARVEAAEIAAAYERSRSQLVGLPEFEAMEQIRENLARRRRAEAYRSFVEDLRKRAEVQIFLEPDARLTVAVDPGADPIRGPADSPITIIEFADFECPHSRKAQGALQRLLGENPDKVRLVFKHFPLPSHPSAFLAARASLCAQEQGRFWEYHDALFSATPPFSRPDLQVLAERIGLERKRFADCLSSDRHSDRISEHVRSAQAAGVTGTPTFVVNGRIYRGALPYDDWDSIVRQQMRALAAGR
jgi:protein-disulfide isomerase